MFDLLQAQMPLVRDLLDSRCNREEGLGPEVDFYLAYWVEACELPETEAPTTLVFERGIDGNVYFDGRQVTITLLK
jgi:hypothetical protein